MKKLKMTWEEEMTLYVHGSAESILLKIALLLKAAYRFSATPSTLQWHFSQTRKNSPKIHTETHMTQNNQSNMKQKVKLEAS